MNVTIASRKCERDNCLKPAVFGERLCDTHLIDEWVRLYQDRKTSIMVFGHGVEFGRRDLAGNPFCVLCNPERLSHGV